MHVCIIGAGPVGLLQSLYLVKYHKQLLNLKDECIQISIFERRSQQDLIYPSSGQRSINLALSWRGMKALEEIELLQEVLKDAVPMRGRYIHPLTGNAYVQPYSSHADQVIYSIERLKIQKILLKAVLNNSITGEGIAQVKINFRQQLVRLDPNSLILDFTSIKTVRADLVLGCDGAFSKVRTEVMKHYSGKLAQETFKHQYREFKIPANVIFSPINFLHIWPRKDLMLIALPNIDGSFTATLFCDFDGIGNDPVNFFKSNFPDFFEAVGIDRFLKDWSDNTASKLVTVQVDPIGIGKIVLLGDAAHSILPFYGQGMNAGFEDVQIFTKHLLTCQNVPEAISKYSHQRIPDAKCIDALARDNYKEMRDQVLSPVFLLRSKALQLANRFFPSTIIPRYSMISFTSIPYSSIKKREITQDFIIIAVILLILLVFFIDL